MRCFRWSLITTSRCRPAFTRTFGRSPTQTSLPIILHDIPSRTIRELSDDTLARLAESSQFIGLRDGTGDVTRPMRLRPLLPPGFRLLSGDDATALAFIADGGDGCISLVSNIAPDLCRTIFTSCRQGRLQSARYLQSRLAPLTAALAKESPAALKYALCLLGFMSPGHPPADRRTGRCSESRGRERDRRDRRRGSRLSDRELAWWPLSQALAATSLEAARMSSNVPGAEWHARTLRAWQLAILRFAVTLDKADRLAALAIASEIDRLGPEDKPGFGFFRQDQRRAMRRHSAAERAQRRGLAAAPCADRRRPAAARLRRGHRNRRAEDIFDRQTVQTRRWPLEGAFPANQPAGSWVAQEVRDSAANSGAVGRRAIERMFFVPFRPGTAHIMVVRAVFPARTVPGRAEKRQHGAGGVAKKRNQNGYGERNSWHMRRSTRKRESESAGLTARLPSRTFCRREFARHPIIIGPVQANTHAARAHAPYAAASHQRSPRSCSSGSR